MRPLEPIGRLVQSLDFERVLRTRSRGQSAHFAVHHLPDRPSLTARARRARESIELSTPDAPPQVKPVDKSCADAVHASEGPTRWLGVVLPKRHAKRAVTRSLLKRQIRQAALRHVATMPAGLWVVRLRVPFDRRVFVSAASDALKRCARAELEQLFQTACRATSPPSSPPSHQAAAR